MDSKHRQYIVLIFPAIIFIVIGCVRLPQVTSTTPTEDPNLLLMQIHATQTALAQLSTPSAEFTPLPTETTAITNIPAVDKSLSLLKQVGGQGLITALIMLLLGILIARFNDVMNLLGRFFGWIWAIIRRRSKE